MKEYKVDFLRGAMGPKKMAKNAEEMLNRYAAEGWDFKLKSDMYWIFEREK